MSANSLWAAFAAGDESARQCLLVEHLGLVHYVARQVSRSLSTEVDLDELVSSGTLGLMHALENFDASRGLAFSTFATPRIRGAMLDELRRQDHVPRSVRRKTRYIGGAREALMRELGRMPEEREIAAQLGLDVDTLWRWQADVEGAVVVPLERAAEADGPSPAMPGDTLFDEEELTVDEQVNHEQEVGLLKEALVTINERERTVLSLYYYEELKLHEIAAILRLTESRVSQIRSKALLKLRAELQPLRQQVA